MIFDLGELLGKLRCSFVSVFGVTSVAATKRSPLPRPPRSKITNSRTNPSWIRCETSSAKDSLFFARSFAIWRQACSTVVWSRPPKLLPISGSDSCVNSLASAIATCRGRATARERFFECMSETLDLVVVGDRLLDVVDRDLAVLHGEQVAQRLLGAARSVISCAVEVRVRQDRASARLRVRARWLRMCFAMKNATCSSSAHAIGVGLLQQDRHAHLELRRLERHREAPAEARDQPLLDAGDFLRVGVAGDDDLLVRLDQRVEQVEELFLRAALAAEELDVVDQQQVERPVVALEIVERLVLVGAHDVGHVLSRRGCSGSSRPGCCVQDLVADRLDQVRLAEARRRRR